MKNHLLASRGFALCFLGAFAFILNGCASSNAQRSSTSNNSTSASGERLAAIAATPTPKPAPSPTPLWRGQIEIPQWARGKALNHVPVAPKNKVLALTFDDGPWPEYTRQILRILRDKKAKATFYMVGQEVTRRPELAREVRDAGHAVGNHSWDHPSRPRDPRSQVKRTDAAIFRATGMHSRTFRPPYGIIGKMTGVAQKQGNAVLLWSADSNDWAKPGANRIARNIISQATPGGVALMHDGGGSREQTVRALPVIIDSLRKRGYKFVTVPELLRMRFVKARPKPKPHPAKTKAPQQKNP